jgi:hypothetical protein
MATQLEQYFKWKVVSFISFGAILLIWFYVPAVQKRVGLPGLIGAIFAASLAILYGQYTSGYNRFWYLSAIQ